MSEQTTNFDSGAVRSADANHLDFTALPLIGLIGVARTAAEGTGKYGRYNYMKGMPVHDLLNHSFRHMIMDILGDRSEPHLEHAAWGILTAIQSRVLNPEISAPHMLGPGATLTAAVHKRLDEQAPILKAKREAGEFRESGHWCLSMLPEIQTILDQREWPESDDSLEPTPEEQDAWAKLISAAQDRLAASTKAFSEKHAPIITPAKPTPEQFRDEVTIGALGYLKRTQEELSDRGMVGGNGTRTESHIPIVFQRDTKYWDF